VIKQTILEELESVRHEIEGDPDAERATLEGWEKALLWVLRELDKGEGE
jgi:hypothetical protein